MSGISTNFYAHGRSLRDPGVALHDSGSPPPERLLQAVWQHQRLRRDRLMTLDGRPLRIIHPGFISHEGGPDFRQALVQIGSEPARSGDVEIDLRPGGWRAHGHDRNPAFRNVILHVVWDVERTLPHTLPVLSLKECLDASLTDLSRWHEHEPAGPLPETFQGRCSAPLRNLNTAQLDTLLREAALVRLAAKAEQFQVRAKHAGWEQALWEGLFRALGYKHNTWPMQCLAETRERWLRDADSAFTVQARLLGIGGLLPAEMPTNSRSYLRQAWDQWWRERDEFEDCLIPRAAWRFHGLRPANHPQRRLALAAHWLTSKNLVSQLERWGTDPLPDRLLVSSLLKILAVPTDDFWSWHWTFRSARLKQPQPLLGDKRVTDLAMNILLPWLWTRARKNRTLQTELEKRYFTWPAAEDNAVLKLARQRLLGGTVKTAFRQAAAQQGLLQIVRDFCEHSNAACENCRFPELVKQWTV